MRGVNEVLKIDQMNSAQLKNCIDKACTISSIQDDYNNQINTTISNAYNGCLNLLDNDKFSDLEKTYPVLNKYIMEDKNVGAAIRKRKWNRVLYWLTNPYIVMLLIGVLLILGNDAYDDVAFFYVVCGIAIFFISRKFPSLGELRRELLSRGRPKFVDRINNNLNVLVEGSKLQVKDAIDGLVENRTSDLLSDVSAIACYQAIPSGLRNSAALFKMKSIMDQGIADSWKEVAGMARREMHDEAMVSEVKSSIEGLGEQLSYIQDNQLKLITQNEEIKGILHNVENNQLTQINQLNQLNKNVSDLKGIASSINTKVRISTDAAIDTNYRIRKGFEVKFEK